MRSSLRSTSPSPYGVSSNFPTSRPTENPPAGPSSSSQVPVQPQQAGRPANIRAPRAATLLPANRIVPASTAWVETYKTSGSESEKFLASTLLSHIENGTLELGIPTAQSTDRAQYGKRITHQGNRPAVMVINFTVRADGQLEPSSAALRDELSRQRVATICRPLNIPEVSTAIGAQSADMTNRTYIDLTRATAEPETPAVAGHKHSLSVSSGSPGDSPSQAGPNTKRVRGDTPEPSDAPSGSGSAPVVLAPDVRRNVTQIVTSLIKWDQGRARTRIEQKLSTISTKDEQMKLLHGLSKQLSTAAAADKMGVITAWADTATVEGITAAADTRTATERRLQDQLSTQKRNIEFDNALKEIAEMFPAQTRRYITNIHIAQENYHSVLFRHVFADSRGPVIAIQAIRDHLKLQSEVSRSQALKDWKPQQH